MNGALAGRTAGLRRFRLQLGTLVVLFTLAVYGALYLQTERLLFDTVRTQASSYYDLIYQVREWNSEHGGVWVEKNSDVGSNPYLLELGVVADTSTVSGTQLTLRNPAAMMSGVAELTHADTGVRFTLIAEDPVSPGNEPDAWEREALDRLAGGSDTYMERVEEDVDPPVYRYVRPLKVEESCAPCHRRQGLSTGDTHGAISVTIPIDGIQARLADTGKWLVGLTVVTLGLALGLGQVFIWRLDKRLEHANQRLARMAVTDDLTGLPNRRATFQQLTSEFARAKRSGARLSVIEIDLDHFKRVNDDFGHRVGDEVLREAARRMRDCLRDYDILGRIGGEEFLVIAPETGAQDILNLSTRLINAIGREPVVVDDVALFVTGSGGCATLTPDDERADDLVVRADVALYQAKRSGRDRVASADESSEIA